MRRLWKQCSPTRTAGNFKALAARIELNLNTIHIRIASGVAENYCEPQGQQLLDEGAILKVGFKFSQLPPVPQHQQT